MTHHDPDLSRIFRALADPTRRAMLERLLHGPASVGALAPPSGMALPTVLRHLSVLEDAALIATVKTGRTRMCRVCPETMATTEHWLSHQRAVWEARTDQLETLLATLDPETANDSAEPRA